jgi:dihydroneopterin aldolase
MTINIIIRNLTINVDIGIYRHEIGVPQPVQFSMDVRINPQAIEIDEITSTVDYDALQAMIIETATAKHYNLLENLCHTIVQRVIALPQVLHASVEAQKLNIPKHCEAIIVRVDSSALKIMKVP